MATGDTSFSDTEYKAVLSDGDEDDDLSAGEKLLKYARNGEVSKLADAVTSSSLSHINCKGRCFIYT